MMQRVRERERESFQGFYSGYYSHFQGFYSGFIRVKTSSITIIRIRIISMIIIMGVIIILRYIPDHESNHCLINLLPIRTGSENPNPDGIELI